MGLRPTKRDEKHAERRMPGERTVGLSAFFSGAAVFSICVFLGRFSDYLKLRQRHP